MKNTKRKLIDDNRVITLKTFQSKKKEIILEIAKRNERTNS